MSGERPLDDADLHAYVDGVLDGERTRAVEEVLARNAVIAGRVADYRADKLALKNLYGSVDAESLPSAWAAMIETKPRAVPARRLLAAIAAALFVFVAGSSIYLRLSTPAETGIVASALSARNDIIQPVEILPASTDAGHYNVALRAVVGASVKVPVLDRLGYRFDGLRTYKGAAEVLYRNGEGRVFSLYLRRSEGQVRFDQFERDGLRVCIWQDDQISMVMAGNISAAIMQRLASLAYMDLSA
jgi:anti-sigma factor RsiW